MSRMLKLCAVLALVIYFVFAVAKRTPVEIALSVLQKAAPNLQLSDVSGSFWSGRASSAQLDIGGQALNLGALRWQLRPSKLLMLRACASLESDMASGDVCRTLSGANLLDNVRVDLPASFANQYVPQVSFAGNASLNLKQASINDKGQIAALNGGFSWLNAYVEAQGQGFDLGDYGADLTNNSDGGLLADIFDLKGPFTVKFNASLTPGQEPSLNGRIIPKPEAPAVLVDGLGLVASQNDAGAFEIDYAQLKSFF